MQGQRLERVIQQLKQEIAMILHREIKDPRLGFVTVTRVEVSKDLRHAKVYYSCLGGKDAVTQSQEALNSSSGYVHALLKSRLRIKAIPSLMFRFDPAVERTLGLQEAFERADQQPASGADEAAREEPADEEP